MFIHKPTCISAQQTFGEIDLNNLKEAVGNQFKANEPDYQGIPPGILRRMGKAVRMGVGAALPILTSSAEINGIIIGTADGGMEDCIKFLNQIIDYEEGMLTPGNFVQSTPNAIAAQMALTTKNRQYNITHVHRGLAFENALTDAWMLLKEYPERQYLVGAVDEISAYNYNIDFLQGWYKKEPVTAETLYNNKTEGSLAGEGAAMFLVNNRADSAVAQIRGIHTLHSSNPTKVQSAMETFLANHLTGNEKPDLLITGENGDVRLERFYAAIENELGQAAPVARYKHLTGEFATSTGPALWLACHIGLLPRGCFKTSAASGSLTNILLYNNFKGVQHSFMLLHKMTNPF